MININGQIIRTQVEFDAATAAMTDYEKAALQAFFNGGTPSPQADMVGYVKTRVLSAMDFGKNLMAEYGASNIVSGLTLAQVKQVMLVTADVQAALLSGSLYVALDEVANIVPDGVVVTESKITDFRHKIQDYLGMART
jgi:hypothetical protein